MAEKHAKKSWKILRMYGWFLPRDLGWIYHRSGRIDEKNLLVTGQISVDDVIELIKQIKGGDFETSSHHFIAGLDFHIFKPNGWYIKCYFIEPDIFFISVHR